MRPELPVLIKARALIADPAKWGKGLRRNRAAFETYCAAEAIEAVEPAGDRRKAAYRAVKRAASTDDLVRWNDAPERIHADVLDAIDKAIASAS